MRYGIDEGFKILLEWGHETRILRLCYLSDLYRIRITDDQIDRIYNHHWICSNRELDDILNMDIR